MMYWKYLIVVLSVSASVSDANIINTEHLDLLQLPHGEPLPWWQSLWKWFIPAVWRSPVQSSCTYSIELAHLQQASNNYQAGLQNLVSVFPQFLDLVQDHQSHFKYSLLSFTDKPVPTDPSGYCLKVETNLTEAASIATTDPLSHLELNSRQGGGQLGAIARAVLTDQVGWSHQNTTGGLPLVKILLIVTNSIPNRFDDALKVTPSPTTLFQNEAGANLKDPNVGCATEDYPEASDVGRVLKDNHILPIFLLSPANSTEECSEWKGSCDTLKLHDLAVKTGNDEYLDPMKGMRLVYEDLLKEMGIPGMISLVQSNLSDFLKSVEETLKNLNSLICEEELEEFLSSTTTTTTTTTMTTSSVTVPTTMAAESTSTATVSHLKALRASAQKVVATEAPQIATIVEQVFTTQDLRAVSTNVTHHNPPCSGTLCKRRRRCCSKTGCHPCSKKHRHIRVIIERK